MNRDLQDVERIKKHVLRLYYNVGKSVFRLTRKMLNNVKFKIGFNTQFN